MSTESIIKSRPVYTLVYWADLPSVVGGNAWDSLTALTWDSTLSTWDSLT